MKAASKPRFVSVRRQQFRSFFQPSRIVLGIFRDGGDEQVNAITLCFDMYCSYKPPMMAFSIHKKAHSYKLLDQADECVLAVPGESLAEEVMYCGTKSATDGDKFKACEFDPIASERVEVPGIAQAIANIEVRIMTRLRTGDHLTAIGQVLRFAVNTENEERCLLSVGPRTAGYRILVRQGIHRIAVISDEREEMSDVPAGAKSRSVLRAP